MSNRTPFLPADLDQLAVLLDVDGTILDLAPTPREVFVSHALRDTLARLWRRTGGAAAFVSGRPVSELDLMFAPLQLPAIGGHGAELRIVAGAAPEAPRLPPLDPAVKRRFAAVGHPYAVPLVRQNFGQHPRVLGFIVHHQHVPCPA